MQRCPGRMIAAVVVLPMADIVGTFEGVTGHQGIKVTVGCAFTVSPDMISVGGSGGSQAVTVTAAPIGCSPSAWMATANDVAVSVSQAAGDGNGTVMLTVAPNTTTSVRSHAATIAERSFTCTFGLSKGDGSCSQSFPAGGTETCVVNINSDRSVTIGIGAS